MSLLLTRPAILSAAFAIALHLPGGNARAADVIHIPDQAAAEDEAPVEPEADDTDIADASPDFDKGGAVLTPAWFFDGNSPFPFSFFSNNDANPSAKRQRPRTRAVRRSQLERNYAVSRHPRGGSYKRRVETLLRNTPISERAKGPLLFTISLSRQSVKVYDAGVEVARGPVSTGMPGHPTPMGVFSVLERESWHRSNIYSGAPMPFMQRLTWTGIAMHAGDLPGYPASHGCIRLPERLALRLWHLSGVGARVVIARNELTPEEIDHPMLFQPNAMPPQPESAPMSRPLPPENAPVSMNAFDRRQAEADAERDRMMLAAADDGEEVADADTGTSEPRLQFALALSGLEGAQDDQPLLHVLSTQRRYLRRHHVKPPEAQYAEIFKTSGAISVFVSRRDGRIYLRKDAQPLFDLPIAIS